MTWLIVWVPIVLLPPPMVMLPPDPAPSFATSLKRT